MQVQSYLMFNGRCEEAIEFYKKAIGAKVEMMMRFKDAPEGAVRAGHREQGHAFVVQDRRHRADGDATACATAGRSSSKASR